MIIIVLLGTRVIAAAKFKQENVDGEILPVSVLELVDTNTDTDIDISELLIRNGYAKTNVSDAIELEYCSSSSSGYISLSGSSSPTPAPKQEHVEPVGKVSKLLSVLELQLICFCSFLAELSDGRKIHIINIDDVLYLRGIELAKIILRFQQAIDMYAELAQLNCPVNRNVIEIRTHPNVFMELAT